MKEQWGFYNPVHVHYGRGVRKVLVDQLTNQSCLIVTSIRGRQQMLVDPILKPFVESSNIQWVDTVNSNPGIDELQSAMNEISGQSFNAIIGFGGGSALDSAKTLSIALSSSLKDIDLVELLSKPALYQSIKPVPLFSVPTTSGTGSEVTPFATIWDHQRRKKHSLFGESVFSTAAIIDPELTDNQPLEVTISTGLDAINQSAESIWNKNAMPITIAYATRALQLGFEALPKLIDGGENKLARDKMAECSMLAGLAISQTRTSLCHSISYPITAHFGVPHGLACAFTMPSVLQLNMEADDGRFDQLQKALGTKDLFQKFYDLNESMEVNKRVKNYISDLKKIKALVGEMYTPGRADNNLANVDNNTIAEIIEQSWWNHNRINTAI